MQNDLVETSPETPIGEEAPNPDLVQQDATDGAETPAEPAKTAEQIEIDRLKRELAHKERALTKRDRTQGKLHQEREQLSAELERLRQGQPAPEGEAKPALGERDVMTLAEQIAARREFDAKCNTVADKGKEKFKDFSASLTALIEEAGPLVGNNGVATALGEQILESDEPHELIQYLGKNPELAAELDGLSPSRMARKLAAFELQMAAKPKTSSAPKPLEPVKGTAAGNDLNDNLSTEEWLKRRRKQLAR